MPEPRIVLVGFFTTPNYLLIHHLGSEMSRSSRGLMEESSSRALLPPQDIGLQRNCL